MQKSGFEYLVRKTNSQNIELENDLIIVAQGQMKIKGITDSRKSLALGQNPKTREI